MGDASKSVVAGVASVESVLSMFAECVVEGLEYSVHDQCSEGGGEGASLVDAFLHGDGFP